jgi:hypothetical protein
MIGTNPGFQTRPLKANDVNWDDEDMKGGKSFKPLPPDEDVPFSGIAIRNYDKTILHSL